MEHYKNYSLEKLTQEHEGVLYIEQWMPVKGYEDYYEISNFGRVKSLARTWVTGERFGVRTKGDTIAKGGLVCGYINHILCVNRKKKTVLSHVLVAKHFIANPNNLPVVNHLNSVRHDNFFKNLEWTTVQGNVQHGFEFGFREGRKGSKHHNTDLTEPDIIEIRRLCSEGGISQKQIGEKFGLHQKTVSKIHLRQRWKHIL